MKIVLRIFVVLLLILSGVSLFLGIMLFNQREQLKARIHTLENGLVDVSAFIEAEQGNDLAQRRLTTVDVKKKDLKRYFKLNADGTFFKTMDPASQKMIKVSDGEGTLKHVLANLKQKTMDQRDRLDETREELQVKRDELSETKDKLSRKKAELSAANEKIEEQKDTIADVNEENTELSVTIDTKDEIIVEHEGTISQNEEKISKQADAIFERDDHIAQQKKYITELKEEIERLKAEDSKTFVPITSGYKGEVLQVNPKWNFIVISVSDDTKLARGIVLLIQRDKKLVAKVKVTKVKHEENRVIAEIIPEWLQMPIQKGDAAVYHR